MPVAAELTCIVRSQEYTKYHFDVEPDALRPALERFAGFFVAPLCKQDALGRELQALPCCPAPGRLLAGTLLRPLAACDRCPAAGPALLEVQRAGPSCSDLRCATLGCCCCCCCSSKLPPACS